MRLLKSGTRRNKVSTETLSVVRIKFKKDLVASKETKILKVAEEVFEASFKYDKRFREYVLENVNWSSHIYEDDVETFYKENKKYFEEFECSLYHLGECPFYIHSSPEGEEIRTTG